MNHCSKCFLTTTEYLPIMQSTGIGICKECLEKMKSEEVKKELFNVQQAPFEL